jgi:hypothetical protein
MSFKIFSIYFPFTAEEFDLKSILFLFQFSMCKKCNLTPVSHILSNSVHIRLYCLFTMNKCMDEWMNEWMNKPFSCIYVINFLLNRSASNKTMPIGMYVIMIWKFIWIIILNFVLKFSIQQTLNLDNFYMRFWHWYFRI